MPVNPVEFYSNEPVSTIGPVRGYTKEQAARIIKEVEADSLARQETREYLKNYQNPQNLSFGELLDQAMGKSLPEDDDAFILDI